MRLVAAFVLVALIAPRVYADEPRDPIELKLGTLAVDGSRYMIDMLALGKEIEKRSKHSLSLTWSSGGQVGDEAKMADLVLRGKLDGGGFSQTGLAAIVSDMTAWGAPARFRTYDDVDKATAAADASVREQFVKRGVTFVMWADLGFSNLFAAKPVTDLHDLFERAKPWLGMKLDGKLVDAIVKKTAAAWAMPPLYMLAIGTDKAAVMANLDYNYVVGGLVIGKTAWARLTPKEQSIVVDVCHEWEPKLRKSWRAETTRAVAALKKSGVAQRTVTTAEVDAYFAASGSGAARSTAP